jgi:hypothetical protein
MDRLVQDLRYALRRMARSPGFTTIAVISLALGIGANTAIFSLVNAVLLSGVPMRAPEEVVEVYTSEENDGYPYSLSSIPDLMDLKDRTRRGRLLGHVLPLGCQPRSGSVLRVGGGSD